MYDDSLYSYSTLIILINSISQSWALYSLMLFYQVHYSYSEMLSILLHYNTCG